MSTMCFRHSKGLRHSCHRVKVCIVVRTPPNRSQFLCHPAPDDRRMRVAQVTGSNHSSHHGRIQHTGVRLKFASTPAREVATVIAPSLSGDIKMSIFQKEIGAPPFRLAPSLFHATRYPPLTFTRRRLTQPNCFAELSARHGWRFFLHLVVDSCATRDHWHGLLRVVHKGDGLNFESQQLLFTPFLGDGLDNASVRPCTMIFHA